MLFILSFVLSLSLYAKDSDILKIGVILPLTGEVAGFGKQLKNGIEEAQKRSQFRNYQIFYEDTQGTPQGTYSALNNLVKRNKVHLLLGEITTRDSTVAADYAKTEKMPLVSPGAGNNDLTLNNPWVSRICFHNEFQGTELANFAYKNLKVKQVAILSSLESPFSQENDKAFTNQMKKLGVKIVAHNFYSQKDISFSHLFQGVKDSQAVFLPDYYPKAAMILREARKRGLNQPFLGPDGWEDPGFFQLAKEFSPGNYLLSHYFPTDLKKGDFPFEFQKDYGHLPGVLEALGYDVLNFSLAAAAQTLKKDSDPLRLTAIPSQELQGSIRRMKDFKGVTGKITIDGKGNAQKSGFILKTRLKDYELVL